LRRVPRSRGEEEAVFGEEPLFTEMCSGSEAGSYLRLIAFVKKREKYLQGGFCGGCRARGVTRRPSSPRSLSLAARHLQLQVPRSPL